ncbi:MAG: GNAT family N-acetyltransferase [Nitrospirae bacterium]|nr:GNAT family N-acetyltransferase [Nitrospirota bacterium]
MNVIKVYPKQKLPLRPDIPGAMMWAVGLEKAMLTYFEMEPNTVFPVHSHVAEQITLVIEGELTFTYEGKTVVLKSGDVIAIPSKVPHSAFTGKSKCCALDAWSPVRKEFLYHMRPALSDDMPFIKECIERFRLDDENLDYRQFVVAVEGNEIAGFGRIRPHKEVYRNQGIGKMIVKYLIDKFPTNQVYITTDLIDYFERFGFKRIEAGPKELVEKLQRVCKSKCREGAVVMSYKKDTK